MPTLLEFEIAIDLLPTHHPLTTLFDLSNLLSKSNFQRPRSLRA
jgi:hypothetical protein